MDYGWLDAVNMVSVLPPANLGSSSIDDNNRAAVKARLAPGRLGSTSPADGGATCARWVRLSVSLFTHHVDVVETQMFATFIDNKIMSQWQEPEQCVKVFDLRNNAKVATEDTEDDPQKAVYKKLDSLEGIGKLVWHYELLRLMCACVSCVCI